MMDLLNAVIALWPLIAVFALIAATGATAWRIATMHDRQAKQVALEFEIERHRRRIVKSR